MERISLKRQVFAPNKYEAVEFSVEGTDYDLPEWYNILANATDKYGEVSALKASPNPTVNKLQEKTPQLQEAVKQPTSQSDKAVVPTSNTKEITMKNFVKWSPSNPDITLPLKLDGEQMSLKIGNDTPNGVKVLLLSEASNMGWNLRLPIGNSGGTPFTDYGDLKEGFSLFAKDYDFDGDKTPEVVITASNELAETYIWVFSYNFVASENETVPLESIWYGEGQSDVLLEGNKILLPFGSQGLVDEYVFSNGTFKKQ